MVLGNNNKYGCWCTLAPLLDGHYKSVDAADSDLHIAELQPSQLFDPLTFS